MNLEACLIDVMIDEVVMNKITFYNHLPKSDLKFLNHFTMSSRIHVAQCDKARQ